MLPFYSAVLRALTDRHDSHYQDTVIENRSSVPYPPLDMPVYLPAQKRLAPRLEQ